ncbi:MAG: hypothetical protein ACI4M6_02040 [Christensenellaceae bacterium]
MEKRVKTTIDWAFYFYSAIFGAVIADILLFIMLVAAIVNRGYTSSGMSGFDRVSVGSMILITLLILCIVGVNAGLFFAIKHLKKTKGNYVRYQKPDSGQNGFQGASGVFFRSEKIRLAMTEIQKRRSVVYSDGLSVSDFKSRLKRHLEINNVRIDEVFLNEIVAGMISSRLIVIKGNNVSVRQLVRVLGAFFGYEMITTDRVFGYRSHDQLIFSSSENSETDFATAVFQAVYRPEAVNVVPMVGCNTSQIDLYFSRFLRYVKAPNYPYAVKIGKTERLQGFDDKIYNGLVTLPPNVWFVAGGKQSQTDMRYLKFATVIDLDKDLSEEINYAAENRAEAESLREEVPFSRTESDNSDASSANQEVALTQSDDNETVGTAAQNARNGGVNAENAVNNEDDYYNGSVLVNTNNVISYKNLTDITEECLKEHSPGLDSWKKIDELEKYLASVKDYKIDNIFFRQLERYAAALCGLRFAESQALDVLIANRILPTVSDWDPALFNKSEIKIAEFIVNLLGEGNCTNSLRALKAMNLA